MLELCRPRLIEKTRYKLMHGGHEWIVDEFHGLNRGLLLAEVELETGEEDVELPSWVGREVTDDNRYYNQYLSNHPYSGWPQEAGEQ
jgi:CYTH domain-containing protein